MEHVAIFDEAQRSWTHKRLADYLKRGGTYGNKQKVPNFPVSEAAFLIWSLDQREDWATIICLVGGGQEINTGEAGISEWIQAINEKFPHWKVYISPKLTEAEYAEGRVNELLADNQNVTYSEDLHLGVSLRSYRAEKLSAFVHALLSFDYNAKAFLCFLCGFSYVPSDFFLFALDKPFHSVYNESIQNNCSFCRGCHAENNEMRNLPGRHRLSPCGEIQERNRYQHPAKDTEA